MKFIVDIDGAELTNTTLAELIAKQLGGEFITVHVEQLPEKQPTLNALLDVVDLSKVEFTKEGWVKNDLPEVQLNEDGWIKINR